MKNLATFVLVPSAPGSHSQQDVAHVEADSMKLASALLTGKMDTA